MHLSQLLSLKWTKQIVLCHPYQSLDLWLSYIWGKDKMRFHHLASWSSCSWKWWIKYRFWFIDKAYKNVGWWRSKFYDWFSVWWVGLRSHHAYFLWCYLRLENNLRNISNWALPIVAWTNEPLIFWFIVLSFDRFIYNQRHACRVGFTGLEFAGILKR